MWLLYNVRHFSASNNTIAAMIPEATPYKSLFHRIVGVLSEQRVELRTSSSVMTLALMVIGAMRTIWVIMQSDVCNINCLITLLCTIASYLGTMFCIFYITGQYGGFNHPNLDEM